MKPPKYLKRVLETLNANNVPGTVTYITVLHDDDCALLGGTGDCNCEPEIFNATPDIAKRKYRASGRARTK
jgi:hypothetical protein